MRVRYNKKATGRVRAGLPISQHNMYKEKPKSSDFIYLFTLALFLVAFSQVALSKAQDKLASIDYSIELGSALPLNNTVEAKELEVPLAKKTAPERSVGDPRATKLHTFLLTNDSPLAPYASYIVEQSDRNGIDWTLLVAISKIESNYCKATIQGSHNCWGLGGSNFMYFDSYEQSIDFTAELLSNHYRRNMNEAIKTKYCPSSDGCNPAWADVVTQASLDLIAAK